MSRSKLFFFFLFFLSSLFSCAGARNNNLKQELIRNQESFNYSDKNGSFLVQLSSGFNKKNNSFFTKRSLEVLGKNEDKILEQSIALSSLGLLKKKKTILRPKISQYSVWFEGKKYYSELKLNAKAKAIDIKMVSPESQWNGVKQVKLPNPKSLYCFFSQVIECAKTIGFITESIKNETGTINFYVIWEGYPYLNETFTDFPSELFSKAQLEYDGKTKEEEGRFNLKVVGQSVFYVVDKNEQMKKMFWVSQGISMVSTTLKKSVENNSDLGEGFE